MVKQLIIDKVINTDNYINRISAIEKNGMIINGTLNKDSFSIYIGMDIKECEKYSLSYLLNKELSYFSNKITSIFDDNALEIALQRVEQDYIKFVLNIIATHLLYINGIVIF